MQSNAVGTVLVALCFSTQGLIAQQPRQHAPRDSATHATMMHNMQQHMRMMDSANARIDSLVQRMNRTSGNAKVAAMAQVINELVAQRRAMQTHMHQMMRSHGGMKQGEMMHHGGDTAPTRGGKPKPAASDTSGHNQHHPEGGEAP